MNPLKIVKAVPLALLVAAALASSSTSAMAQAGSLDATFGIGGIATTPSTTTTECCAMAIQSDGKIVAAGGAMVNGGRASVLVRYNIDGSLDQTFGSGGILVLSEDQFGGPAFGIAIQEDGKIVTAAPSDFQIFVFRFNANGTLDASFGSAGRVGVPGFAIGSTPGGVAVQSDGKILVAADKLIRLLNNGRFDPLFGTDGVAPLLSGAFALSPLTSGKILVVGSAFGTTGAAQQYNSDGSLDLTFGVGGQTPNLGQPSAMASLSDGQFALVGGLASGQPSFNFNAKPQGFVVVRYNGDGTIDSTFGTHGAAITNFPSNSFSGAGAVAAQSNGDIVAAGFTAAQNCACSQQPSDFALARYSAEGQLDATFGTEGFVITSFNGDSASITALAIQSDGKIVAAGRDRPASLASHDPGFTLVRYLSE